MTKKRALTSEEINQVRDYVSNREKSLYPDHIVTVSVKKETNDEGVPQVVITRIRELTENVTGY